MAKSADAADLKSATRKGVGVQVPLRAPDWKLASDIFDRGQESRSSSGLTLINYCK